MPIVASPLPTDFCWIGFVPLLTFNRQNRWSGFRTFLTRFRYTSPECLSQDTATRSSRPSPAHWLPSRNGSNSTTTTLWPSTVPNRSRISSPPKSSQVPASKILCLYEYPGKNAFMQFSRSVKADPLWRPLDTSQPGPESLVENAEVMTLRMTDFSPEFKATQSSQPRFFEPTPEVSPHEEGL